MARIYSNENFPKPVVLRLRELGHDVLTTLEAGKSDQEIPDEEMLEFAVKDERAVITLNRRDFMRLHREQPEHFGIIVCKFDADFSGQAKRIHQAITQETDLHGKLIRVTRAG